MAIDLDDEILQDFLVEAGEILEKLGGQLIELEQSPDDMDLLNAVFRGFHTIKGGAGFINLIPLVELCHRAEDVFNLLRTGERKIDPQLMDAILPVTDILEDMFSNIRAGEDPESADPELLALLDRYTKPDDGQGNEPVAETPHVEQTTSTETVSGDETGSDDITDAEFEAILDASQSPSTPAVDNSTSTSESDEITDEEFENLLDELHGEGKHSGVVDKTPQSQQASTGDAVKSSASTTSDEITEEEFDALLDDLHGKGGTPTASVNKETVVSSDAAEPAKQPASEGQKAKSTASDEITEDEFEALLDDLHGKGGAPKSSSQKETVSPDAPKQPTAKKKPQPGKESATAETSVRVDTKRLDDIMNMVGELVLVRNRLSTFKASDIEDELSVAIGNLDVVTTDLQLSVMKTRMQPVKKVFGRFPRVVRDLARNLKKEVNLVLEGEDTDLDKNLVEAIADPMVHLVRNAVDHGIETPEEREAAGKPRQGTVVLSAKQEGDHILLSIQDDGNGMDADVLRKIAIEKGVLDEEAASRLDDRACFNLIFAPGFSTKTEISDVSGRGVGMDVVKSRIVQLNGAVEIDSVKGEGSRFNIKLPLTLAIMPTLMIILGGQRFALPLVNVKEIFSLDLSKTNIVDGQEVILVRDQAVPLFYLRKWLVNGNAPEVDPELQHVLLVTIGNQQVAFVVDQLVGQEEVVIKPLGGMLHGTKGVAGATITGDGRIAMILDVPGMLMAYAGRY